MIRSILSLRGPIIMASVYPFNINSNERYDRPADKVKKSLIGDELGWDRVKKIFFLDEHGMVSKECRSILNITTTGVITGVLIGGVTENKHTVNNFISSNEATKFANHFEARQQLQRQIFLTFIRKGAIMARKLGLFCLIFSTLTTCTTAYRGKLRIENYIFGGSVAGLLNRLNLGLRASLVGAGLGGALGGICGGISIVFLYLTGTNMDHMMQVQNDWVYSKTDDADERIKTYMAGREDSDVKKLFEENEDLRSMEQKYQETRKKVEDPST